MQLNKRQIVLSLPLAQFLETVANGVTIAPVTAEIAIDAQSLPKSHGDQADRLLMAIARGLNCPSMTADRVVHAYAGAGHVRAIDARR